MEKSKKIKLNKKRLCVIAVACIVALIVVCGLIKLIGSMTAGEVAYGNSSNMGLVVNDGKNIFYNKYDQGIVKAKGSKEFQIYNGASESLIVDGDTIYFLSFADSDAMDIKSVKDNGDALTTLKTVYTNIAKIYKEGNYIYYTTKTDNAGIYKLDITTKDVELLLTAYVQDFVVENGKVYYTDSTNKLFVADLDSRESTLITDEYKIAKIQVVKKWIYFYDESENALCKIKTNGKKKQTVATFVNNDTFNVTSKAVYYFDQVNKQICKSDLKGKKSKAIVSLDTARTKINVIKNNVYYLDTSKDASQLFQLFRVKTNGGAAKPIEY